MSHELRTPLNAILGYSELVIEELAEREETASVADVQRIKGAGAHLLAMINDLLDLEKIEAGRMELACDWFDPREMIHEVALTVQPLVTKNANTLA